MIKWLLTGTGRSATRFYSRYLTGLGYTCTHEYLFPLPSPRKDIKTNTILAEASWHAAPFLGMEELDSVKIIHLIRHPKLVIASVRFAGWMRLLPGISAFIQRYTPRVNSYPRALDKLACYYIEWHKLIEANVQCKPVVFYVDKQRSQEMLGIVEHSAPQCGAYDNDQDHSLGRVPGPELSEFTSDLRDELIDFSQRHGYEW